MLGYIIGKLVYKSDGHIIVDNNGIGFNIKMGTSDIEKIGALGTEVKIYTYMSIVKDKERERMGLFGFCGMEELEMFKKLISVSGVGPKSAVSLLSALDVKSLCLAICSEDINKISSGNGIGKRTAQRIILELKDKIDIIVPIESAEEYEDVSKDAAEALTALGFGKSETIKAISAVDNGTITTEEIVKRALKLLSGRWEK